MFALCGGCTAGVLVCACAVWGLYCIHICVTVRCAVPSKHLWCPGCTPSVGIVPDTSSRQLMTQLLVVHFDLHDTVLERRNFLHPCNAGFRHWVSSGCHTFNDLAVNLSEQTSVPGGWLLCLIRYLIVRIILIFHSFNWRHGWVEILNYGSSNTWMREFAKGMLR